MESFRRLTTFLFLIIAVSASAQNTKEQRKIIDTHFHTLKWNSFGTPPPANEITGAIPKARSDSEEQSIMLTELKRNNIVKAINTTWGRWVRGGGEGV